jgi:hypothetical protein
MFRLNASPSPPPRGTKGRGGDGLVPRGMSWLPGIS